MYTFSLLLLESAGMFFNFLGLTSIVIKIVEVKTTNKNYTDRIVIMTRITKNLQGLSNL